MSTLSAIRNTNTNTNTNTKGHTHPANLDMLNSTMVVYNSYKTFIIHIDMFLGLLEFGRLIEFAR